MKTTIDSAGRIVVPKQLRDALGLSSGGSVDISFYGAGLQVVPLSRTARLTKLGRTLVADSQTPIDDETIFDLIDSGRR
ncbi:MAG: AbrB/MazE/SpoVT family DNA-binding domain-containing protein [Jatrophihabitantaceae bacterium]